VIADAIATLPVADSDLLPEDNQTDPDLRAIESYTVEEAAGKSQEILDISRLMIFRLQAGYRVDRVGHNEGLSARFTNCQSQYSKNFN